MANFMLQSQGIKLVKFVMIWVKMQICRVGHPKDLVIAVKRETDKFLTKNVVYREVLLHRRGLPPTANLQPVSSLRPTATAAVNVSADQPDDLDYTGIYDGIGVADCPAMSFVFVC